MKKIAILYSNYSPTIDVIKHRLSECVIECFTEQDNFDKYDLVILINYKGEYSGNALVCHHSLLPAFEGENPEMQAMLEGVKLTGITIYYTNPKRIVAQYPVFITNYTHYDTLKQELDYIEQTIFPLVIEKIIRNEVFELSQLLNQKSSCCGGCNSCSH